MPGHSAQVLRDLHTTDAAEPTAIQPQVTCMTVHAARHQLAPPILLLGCTCCCFNRTLHTVRRSVVVVPWPSIEFLQARQSKYVGVCLSRVQHSCIDSQFLNTTHAACAMKSSSAAAHLALLASCHCSREVRLSTLRPSNREALISMDTERRLGLLLYSSSSAVAGVTSSPVSSSPVRDELAASC
jgi:hypothetical protein